VARIRTIKPEFPQSESMGNVSRDARLCFIMLWTIADDSGRLRGASRMLASLLFPYDNDAPKLMDKWLGELEREHCIQRYEVDGAQYIEIAKWLDHQKIDRPSPSKFPDFDASSRTIASPREESSLDQGPRTKDREGIKDHGRRGPKLKTPIDPNWQPDEQDCSFALARGLDPDALREEFVARHVSQATLSADWHASWRTWCLNAVKFAAERTGRSGRMVHRQKPNSLIAAASAVLAQIEGEQ
jgi:hypothetical protein